jgi:lipopolysaccharide heptosyltransferase I
LNSFLIVRLGALGDVVHAIPVAAALRRAFPSSRIDWLVGSRHRELLDLVPVVDRRLVLREREAGDGQSYLSAIGELRRQRYDVAFDLQGLLKSAILARATGATRVVGFSTPYLRERLARLFYTDVYDPGGRGMYDPDSTLHVVQANLGMLTTIGLTAAAAEFPIEPGDSPIARDVRSRVGDRYALVNPGAAWPNKRWPSARFGELARELWSRHRLTSVVSWGPGEDALAREVVDAAPGAAVLAPRTTIADLVALIRSAAVMISGDTGPTHIAAALGTPLVGIYGPTRPARNGPWSADDLTVSRSAVCQCHHLRRCRAPHWCLLDIASSEVAAAVDRRLAAVAR